MDKRILNIGCGKDTYGTDFVDLYPQREEVKKCAIDSERLPFKDNTFDEVVMNFVFEHLKNHELALKEVFRVLKKGGTFTLRTDNASYWYYALDNRTHTGRYEATPLYGETDRHFGLFTDWHMANYFKDIGFKDISVKHSYENSIAKNLNIKGKTVVLINSILTRIKPIRRIGYSELIAKGKK